MRIALIGTRGVPARYGGFETCAEELGKRLVERGHHVTVYGRTGYYRDKTAEYLGLKLIYLPALNIKFLETLSNTLIALVHAMIWGRFDVLLVFNTANSPLLLIPKMAGKRAFLLMDGLEWKREKWGRIGRRYHHLAEWVAGRWIHEIIADSKEIQRYFEKRYGRAPHYISYGAELRSCPKPSLLSRYHLQPGGYFLQITRVEPENNPLLIIRAFEKIKTDKKLVLVGGARYPTDYSDAVFTAADPRLRFLGFNYDRDLLDELLCNCFAYIHGNEVGGTNPSLLEAMASGCFVISRDVPFNREVLEDAGVYFGKDTGDLAVKLAWSLRNPPRMAEGRAKARKIIQERFAWAQAVSEYEKLFREIGR